MPSLQQVYQDKSRLIMWIFQQALKSPQTIWWKGWCIVRAKQSSKFGGDFDEIVVWYMPQQCNKKIEKWEEIVEGMKEGNCFYAKCWSGCELPENSSDKMS